MSFDVLNYNCFGEIITCILSLILIFNVLMTFSIDSKRHRFFVWGSISSFVAAFCDIISVICITYYDKLPLWLDTLVTTVFFLLLCMVPFILCCYANTVAFSYSSTGKAIMTINSFVYVLYVLFILLNIKTGWVFKYVSGVGYVRGNLKNITYATTLYYAAHSVGCMIVKRKSIPRRLLFVFLLYPFISLFVLSFQIFNPKTIMTGLSSFVALFFAYITIQTDLIEYDNVTGLMTETKLKKYVTDKKTEGFVFALSIENINNLMQNMDSTEMNQLLFSIGKSISSCFRNYSYHITSNRFAGVCNNIEELYKNSEQIEKFIKDLNNNYEDILPSPLDVYYVGVSFSKGNITYETVTEVINSMFARVKNEGVHTLHVCDEQTLLDMERKRQIYKILKRELNIDSKQFQVWFQPIYSVQEKKFTYMEALSRLNFTEIGNIPPAEFVEVAENRGLIEKLGNLVFEKVCRFISENRDLVPAVSVNFSVYQMVNPNIVETVNSIMKKYDVSPQNIIMEITESIFIDDFNIVLENMKKLSDLGIKFYLDDFGTGYSNLANVVMLPFSAIKIDRSLVLMTEEDKKGERFFSNILSTFKDSNLNILVEGVETSTQNQIVEQAGADYIQGFLYSRAIPEKDCVELFKNQKKSKNVNADAN